MTITSLANGLSDVNMESHYGQNVFRIPDEFWDEVHNMINEFDVAFDEELIHLKEQESEIAEPSTGHNVSSGSDINQGGLMMGNRRPMKPVSDAAANVSKSQSNGYMSDDCEIVGVTKLNEKKHRSLSSSSSSSSSDSSHKTKKKHKKDKKKKDKKKSKKKHKHRSRSRSLSLEKMKDELKKRLRESELLDEIERLEAEKRRRLKSLSPVPYEPFKINMPDLNYKPVANPAPSTSKNCRVTESGFILKPLAKVRSRSRSKSFEPFISGPMELVIPKDLPNEPKNWRRREKRGYSPLKKIGRPLSPLSRRRTPSPFGRRRSLSPLGKRRSPSPYGKDSRPSRSPRKRGRSPIRGRRSPSHGCFGKSPIRGGRKGRSRTPSPRKMHMQRNYRRREPSKESIRSSASDKASTSTHSEAERRNREGRKSRWSKPESKSESIGSIDIIKSVNPTPVHPIPMKSNSDDEDWDDIVESAPKTSGAGYDIEQIKSAPKQLFNFSEANNDNLNAGTGRGRGFRGRGRGGRGRGRGRGGKADRIYRIDDDEEEDVVMVRPGQSLPRPVKPVDFTKEYKAVKVEKFEATSADDENWDDLVKNKPIEPPSSYDMKEVLDMNPNPKSKRKTLPLLAPNVLGAILEPVKVPVPVKNIDVNRGPRAASEEGELSSHSDDEQTKKNPAFDQPLPPGVEPEEFQSPVPPVKAKVAVVAPIVPHFPPPIIPSVLPPLPNKNKESSSEVLLPPGVDEDEQDTVSSITPLVKKFSDVKKLREKYELMPPGCDEDEFLPPPMDFFVSSKSPGVKKVTDEKKKKEKAPKVKEVEPIKKSKTPTKVQKRDSPPPGCDQEKIEKKRPEISSEEETLSKTEKVPEPSTEVIKETIEEIPEEKGHDEDLSSERPIEEPETKPLEDAVIETKDSDEPNVPVTATTDTSVVESLVEPSPDEPVEQETTYESPEEPEEEEPIPDVDSSKLLADTLIKEKQDEDIIYSRIKESLEKDFPPTDDIRFLMEEYQPLGITTRGLLYREKDDQFLTIIPESLIEQVITSLHVIDSNRHLNKEITTERLTERYFWPFMSDTIHDFIINCSVCSEKM